MTFLKRRSPFRKFFIYYVDKKKILHILYSFKYNWAWRLQILFEQEVFLDWFREKNLRNVKPTGCNIIYIITSFTSYKKTSTSSRTVAHEHSWLLSVVWYMYASYMADLYKAHVEHSESACNWVTLFLTIRQITRLVSLYWTTRGDVYSTIYVGLSV